MFTFVLAFVFVFVLLLKEFIISRISVIEDDLKEIENNYINFLNQNSELSSPNLLIMNKRIEKILDTVNDIKQVEIKTFFYSRLSSKLKYINNSEK